MNIKNKKVPELIPLKHSIVYSVVQNNCCQFLCYGSICQKYLKIFIIIF